jgi:hypothetical protein
MQRSPQKVAATGGKTSQPGSLPTLDNLLRTAFDVLRKFYKSKTRFLVIHHKHFEHYVPADQGSQVQLILTHHGPGHRGWLLKVQPAIGGVQSRRYMLTDAVWPARPGEPIQYSP